METNKKFSIGFITLLCITFANSYACPTKCVPWETCKEFKHLSRRDQKAWMLKYPCFNGQKETYAKVCCPNTEISNNNDCPTTSYPPKPETGCCGLQTSDTDRNIAHSDLDWLEHFGPQRSKRSAEINPVSPRITKGRETELSEYPWTVSLRTTLYNGFIKTHHEGGGSLISSRYVLTAAHCVYNENSREYKMILEMSLAEYNLNEARDCKIIYGQGIKCIDNVLMHAEHVIIHPEYNDSSLKNDIALIRLAGNAPYTKYIRPICLPSINVNSGSFNKIRLAVVGWGYNGDNNKKSNIKQSTTVNLVPNDKCRQVYPGLSGGQMCALGENGQDSCKGDSGGPLMRKNKNGNFELVGVVSGQTSKSSCGTKPALYTNVYYYLSWIHSKIEK